MSFEYRKMREDTENRVFNKYLYNNNYEKDFFSELYENSPKTGDKKKDMENLKKDFEEYRMKRNEIESVHPQYSPEEDISSLEYVDYGEVSSIEDGEEVVSLSRNFISEVELSDLREVMIKLDEYISENEGSWDPITDLSKNMKSIVRVVHRFKHTRSHYIPMTETNQSRDSETIYD